MIPILLKLSNFTSYGENPPKLDFTKFKLAAISGLNGAGKSSLLDAITWCVWGTSRAGDSADSLIHSGSENMQVEFSFELDKAVYTIKRRRSKKGGGLTSLELWGGSASSSLHNLTEGTIKATQEKIINLLRLTFETFTNSSFLRQGHDNEFTTKGPTDRKRILSEILGLSNYDKLEEKSKEKSKDANTRLQLLEYQLLEIEAELSQKDQFQQKKIIAEKKIGEVEIQILDLEKEIKTLSNQIATLKAVGEQQHKLKQTLKDLRGELEEILYQGKNRAEKIKQLEIQLLDLPKLDEKLKELKLLELEKDKYSKILQKKLELENKLMEVKSSLNLKNHQKETLQKNLQEIKKHLQDLEKEVSKCPTCGQIINKEQKEQVLKEYLGKEKIITSSINAIKTKKEDIKILELGKEMNTISKYDTNYQEIIRKINELSSLQENREKLIAAKATLDSEKKVVADLRILFSNKKTQVEKLEVEARKLPESDVKLINLQTLINQKELELHSLRGDEKEARNLLGQATELISRTKQLEKFAIQKQEEKSKLQKEKEIYEELALAFGKKGIQAMIIESAIPEIEDETNNLLSKLTEGRMKVALQTQRETKTKQEDGEKGLIETLDIIISDEMGERPYELYSGGEAFRVNFSIRLAISKLLTHRAGAKLQFLVIDEGFGSQDAPGRARLVEVIDTIKDDFEKILVITHIEELKEEFPVRIEVTKNSKGSTFEVIGV